MFAKQLTVFIENRAGRLSEVLNVLKENDVNILDISQTIVQGYFNMMMIVDSSKASNSFAKISEGLDKLGEEIGVTIKCQREDIFEKMHRI